MNRIANRIRNENGFTLLELIVVLAIIAVLTAILIPQFAGIFTKGDQTSYNTDVRAVKTAVDQFKLAKHDGPDSTPQWGAGQKNLRIYPTGNGLVGDIELDPSATNADDYGNSLVVEWVQGVGVSATPASDADISNALIWMGLLVNEPSTGTAAQQQSTGDAAPQVGEDGQYLDKFPRSASADNTKHAAPSTESFTDGSYYYVILHNGDTAAVYKDATSGKYYAGFNQSYP